MNQLFHAAIIGSLAFFPATFSPSHAQRSQSAVPVELSGFWTNRSLTPLERGAGVDALVLTDAAANELAYGNLWARLNREQAGRIDISEPPEAGATNLNLRGHAAFWVDPGTQFGQVNGEFRSSVITEPASGRIPWRAGGQDVLQLLSGQPVAGSFDDIETRPNAERCFIARAPVMTSGLYNNTFQFVQTADYVVVEIEMTHDARIIPTFDTADEARRNHKPGAIRQWLGDAVGWYEGDALVVETINIHPWQRRHITPSGKVTERFTRQSDDKILYEFTVEDPALYTKPWKGELVFNATSEQLHEYACHEGNYAMPGILRGARVQEAAGFIVDANAEVER